MERLIDVFEANNKDLNLEKNMQIFVAYIGDKANLFSTKYVEKLREAGIYAEKDIMGRSLKAQLKYADKKQAKFVITAGNIFSLIQRDFVGRIKSRKSWNAT